MSDPSIFRKNAAAERALSEKASLPNRKAMHDRSAAMWDELAQQADDTADRTAVNAAAKALPG